MEREYGGDVVRRFLWCRFCGGLGNGRGLTHKIFGPIFTRLVETGGLTWVRIRFQQLEENKVISQHPRLFACSYRPCVLLGKYSKKNLFLIFTAEARQSDSYLGLRA